MLFLKSQYLNKPYIIQQLHLQQYKKLVFRISVQFSKNKAKAYFISKNNYMYDPIENIYFVAPEYLLRYTSRKMGNMHNNTRSKANVL